MAEPLPQENKNAAKPSGNKGVRASATQPINPESQASGTIFRTHHAFMWEASHRPFNLAKKFVRAASPLENRDRFRRAIETI